jgi:serine/threonine protein kinase
MSDIFDPPKRKRSDITIKTEDGVVIVSASCLRDKGIRLLDKLGEGSYGVVYWSCRHEDCIFALKIVSLRQTNLSSAKHEYDRSMEAMRGGYGPTVYDHWQCDAYDKANDGDVVLDFLLIEKMDMTLNEYMHQRRPLGDPEAKKIADVLCAMAEDRMMHNDLHSNNVMVSVDSTGRMVKVCVIDFGGAVKYNVDKDGNIVKCSLAVSDDGSETTCQESPVYDFIPSADVQDLLADIRSYYVSGYLPRSPKLEAALSALESELDDWDDE